MIGCLWTRVRKQPIIALYFEFENELKFYNLGAEAESAWNQCSFPFANSFNLWRYGLDNLLSVDVAI